MGLSFDVEESQSERAPSLLKETDVWREERAASDDAFGERGVVTAW
jgi:hypothetical protein